MDIIEALARQNELKNEPKVRQVHDGQLTINNDIFKLQCQELNLADDIISDVMLEPVESRDEWIKYFSQQNNK